MVARARLPIVTLCLLSCGVLLCGSAVQAGDVSPGDFFEAKIRPLLASRCFECHGPKKQESDLRLDQRDAAMKGNADGPVIVPGQPEKSRLIAAVSYHSDIKMPPKGKLPDQAVADLTTWIRLGAPWPAGSASSAPGVESLATMNPVEAARRHWAFQPVHEPALPAVMNRAWVQSPIDAFVLARLEAKHLAPAPPADRRTLIRRATFDLTGLPPTPAETEAFVSDTAPGAFARVVDRLLASPHYGERWGRYWLDIARYADTRGYLVANRERKYFWAFRFRDWVIRALNDDMPYNQFLELQLAADLMPHPEDDNSSLAALGYLTVGRRFLDHRPDIIDDRIDVVSRGMMGMTVTCARCHNHKFDPIPQEDYYSFYGVLDASVDKDYPLSFTKESPAPNPKPKDPKLKDPQATGSKVADVKSKPKSEPPKLVASKEMVMGLEDRPKHPNPHVFLRGNAGNWGPEVPRRFLAVLSGPNRQPFKDGSGRLELAERIASPDNPLTARVLVNRVWLHHFGEGLVHTPSDFGTRSDPPAEPELLDYLAARFVAEGWSIKRLHRAIMLSSVYQQSCNAAPETAASDPENRLLGRMNRQRLDFEATRDSLLSVAGGLDETRGGPSIDILKQPFPRRRSVYAFIDRQNLPGLFRTFDFASPDTHSPRRYVTTVPQQALFLMNSPFAVEQAERIVKRPEIAAAAEPAERIRRLYRLIYGREVTPTELKLAADYLNAATPLPGAKPNPQDKLTPWERYAQALLMSNEFVFID
jgi:hypothetical protein